MDASAIHQKAIQKPRNWIFVLLPERLAYFTLAPSAPAHGGCLQRSVNIQSSSHRTPESVTPSAVKPHFPECIVQIYFIVAILYHKKRRESREKPFLKTLFHKHCEKARAFWTPRSLNAKRIPSGISFSLTCLDKKDAYCS